MYSQLDFRAKIYQSQEDKKALEKVQDQDCSMKLSGYLGKFNLNLSYLKMLEIYSLTKKGKPSKKSSFKLPKQGMMLNGQLFQQKIWEPVINEKVFGSLPTPSATEYKAGYKEVFYENGSFFRINSKGVKWGVRLADAVKILPTPTTMDHLPQRGFESMVKQTQVHRKGRTKLANLREAVNPQTVELFNKLQNANGNIEEIQSTIADWERYVSKPQLRRGDDGLSNRVARIKALGNSIVPNCAAVPLQRIKDLSEGKC
ncbi:MAG: hypothetical protein CM15mV37_0430 [uncultured marine virus]|nr:MAG: hypothetical protein CM15mV37_0430 [uncultured marine virus]